MATAEVERKPKPGWQTTEFYVSALAMVVPQLMEALPPTWRAGLSVAAGAVYTLARALSKLGLGR